MNGATEVTHVLVAFLSKLSVMWRRTSLTDSPDSFAIFEGDKCLLRCSISRSRFSWLSCAASSGDCRFGPPMAELLLEYANDYPVTDISVLIVNHNYKNLANTFGIDGFLIPKAFLCFTICVASYSISFFVECFFRSLNTDRWHERNCRPDPHGHCT